MRKAHLGGGWLESAAADEGPGPLVARRDAPDIPRRFREELHDLLYRPHYEARVLARSANWPTCGIATADVNTVVGALRSLDRVEFAIMLFDCHRTPQRDAARLLRMKRERYKKALQRLKAQLGKLGNFCKI